MRENDLLAGNGFYPPEEEPGDPVGDVILDDGPGGSGKWTRERLRKPWDRGHEPDHLNLSEEES